MPMIYTDDVEEKIQSLIDNMHYISNREEAIAYIKKFWSQCDIVKDMERQELDERASGITGELLKDVVFFARTDPKWHLLQENTKTAIARLHRELDKVYFPEVDDVL